jgi:ElaB/YqjD/DUF883 family membrane-anchored ribosome-binding protein
MNSTESATAAADTKDQLVANLRRVVADAEELLAATAGQVADGRLAELRDRAKESLMLAREKLADISAASRERARQVADATDDYVHDNPWTSIGVAAAVGMLIGVLLGRR